jgi:tRNA modification GTPase
VEAFGDTVYALATPDVPGPRAVVRISGRLAVGAARKVTRRADSSAAGDWLALASGEVPCEVWEFRAPRSSTGEDVAEIHLPGSPELVTQLGVALNALGCVPAPAGEFSRRAYLNGKLDLAAVEAVMALVSSGDAAGARRACAALRGAVGERARSLRDAAERLCARIEMCFDFDDDSTGGGREERSALATEAEDLAAEMRELASSSAGRSTSRGRVVLCGPVNAGKSTIFNALVGGRRAAVSAEAGTTRDCVSADADLAWTPVTLVDTAGFKAADGEIEGLALLAGTDAAREADLVLVVADCAGNGMGAAARDVARIGLERDRLLLVRSKADERGNLEIAADLPEVFAGLPQIVVCAPRGSGMPELREAVSSRLRIGAASEAPVVSARGAALFATASENLSRAAESLQGEPAMLDAAGDLARAALANVREYLGEGADASILDHIFSHFCIGK